MSFCIFYPKVRVDIEEGTILGVITLNHAIAYPYENEAF